MNSDEPTADILIVDDDASLVEILRMALEDAGFRVQVACNGLKGWNAFQQSEPDLVLLDLLMPELDGMRELETLPQWAKVELVVEADVEARVVGVRSQLERMLLNLLNNALTFCERQVLVRVAWGQDRCIIVVCDDGPGVSEGNRGKVFRRFFSGRPVGKPPGAGLGLATAQVIARSHGGTITLDEEGPLDGACFRIELPRPRF